MVEQAESIQHQIRDRTLSVNSREPLGNANHDCRDSGIKGSSERNGTIFCAATIQINRHQARCEAACTAHFPDAAMYAVADDWRRSRRNRETGRRAYYLSAEYLTGRMIFNNLFVLNLLPEVSRLLALRGVDINIMESIEDCALGNGGLGRLAACFLDSAATHDLPLDGYGVRYKFGLFKAEVFERLSG